MMRDFPQLLQSLSTAEAAAEAQVARLLEAHPHLPTDYVAFLRFSDGAEGSIGRNGYLSLWSAESVLELNLEYAVEEFAPGVVLFGTDGGNTGYGFDLREDAAVVVAIPLVGMDFDDAEAVGFSFLDFLTRQAQE